MSDDKHLKHHESKVSGGAVGIKAGASGYQIKMNSSKSCVVNILKKGSNGNKLQPVVRFDQAHGGPPGAKVPHINLNPKVNTGLNADPHLPIPGGEAGLNAIEGAAKFCKTVNDFLIPVAIAMNVIEGGKAIYNDVKKDTTRNTVETGTSIAGGWGGGYGGAYGGAAIGSLIFPGVGTLIGGIVGGIVGGVAGSFAAEKVTELIGDEFDYDIAEGQEPCKECKRKYKYRKYVRRDNGLCDECIMSIRKP